MRTLKLTLAYDGTNYVGWQRQKNGTSVQQVVEEALQPLCGDAVPVVMGAGRTDAGVHAQGQVASVRVAFHHPPRAIQRALNVRLPRDIRVLDVTEADARFHAQFDATGKSYRYRIATDWVLPPFDRWFVWHMARPCNVEVMSLAARVLVGRHDFSSFQASGGAVLEGWRILERVHVERRGPEIHIELDGDGFLRHMVRIVVGTLVEIGVGHRGVNSMAETLAACNRQAAGRTAPPHGLTLVSVRY